MEFMLLYYKRMPHNNVKNKLQPIPRHDQTFQSNNVQLSSVIIIDSTANGRSSPWAINYSWDVEAPLDIETATAIEAPKEQARIFGTFFGTFWLAQGKDNDLIKG
jgi:hypothetical protein